MRLGTNSININGNNISAGRNISIVQSNGRTIINGRDVTDLVNEEAEKGILKKESGEAAG